MKKAGIFTLTVILIMAMFSGCRGQSSDTTMTTGATNSTTKTTQATTKATLPAPVITSPSTTGATSMPLQPGGTDGGEGSQMPRRHAGPHY